MLLFLRHLPVVLFLPVFFLPSCFWKETEGDVTAPPSGTVLYTPSLNPPASPVTDDNLRVPPSPPSDGQMPAPPPSPPGTVQPPGPPSSSTDGQLPLPPSSSSGWNQPYPPALPPSLPPPSPPGTVQPPGPPSSPTDGQLPFPPSSSSGGNPPSPPSGGQMPLPPPSPPGTSQPPGSPSSSTDGQLPFPPSSSSGGNPPSPPLPPSAGGGSHSGGNLLTTTVIPTVATVPSPTGPSIDSFLLSSLRPNCSPDSVPSDASVGPQWDEDIRRLTQRCIETYADFKKYSCQNRCGLQQRDDSAPLWSKHLPRCFCDKFCGEFGDCCYDFDALCQNPASPVKSPLTSNETCLALKYGFLKGYTSFAAWNTCPKNWTERSVRHKCQHEDQSELLKNLPVFDMDSHVTYKNIFCARCNGAVNAAYWSLTFVCPTWFNTTAFNFRSSMDFLRRNCSLQTSLYDSQLKYLKRCIPRFQDCRNISRVRNESYCQTECLRYAFPVCVDTGKIRFGNPQCGLCNGYKLSDLECDCLSGSGPVSPPLTILFDFSSTSMSIKVYDRQEQVTEYREQFWSCSVDEVYDPYTSSCQAVTSPGENNNHQQNQHNETQAWDPNCTFIAFNETDYKQLSNGSVYLKLHNKTYSNTTYVIHENSLLLCVDFSRTPTGMEKKRVMYRTKRTPASLQLLTSIGCIVSMVSLVLLLTTYTLFAELRNLPGNIIINLAVSLLLYQSVFFAAVKNDNQDTCLAIAVFLHLFVLSSFTWMNVMAYDVHRIFTPSDGVAANRQGSYKKRLIMYYMYAWGTPTVAVLVCVTVDQVKKGSIGYGQGEDGCFISQPKALLYSFVLPVALLILYNLLALGHIMIRIVKTRKETQQITNQRHGANIAVICVKMASVMGVTWILGISANFMPLSFLWYPFVVLNSLQGLFIFLSFVVSGRALELYRSKLSSMLRNLTAKRKENKRNDSNGTVQSTCDTSGDYRDTLDTRL